MIGTAIVGLSINKNPKSQNPNFQPGLFGILEIGIWDFEIS